MQVHIQTTNSLKSSLRYTADVMQSYASARERQHTLTDDPAAADLILLVGDVTDLSEARAVPLAAQYPSKAFAYSEIDANIPFFPGVYNSARKDGWLHGARTRSFVYLSSYGSARNAQIAFAQPAEKDLLCSFRGRRVCRVRAYLMEHNFHAPDVEVVDSTQYAHWSSGPEERVIAQGSYVATMMRSHFALCPRGAGFGSIRLFEAMELGVAPVLLSDYYQLPHGPDWGRFLIQIPEKDYAQTADILRAHVSESAERGRLAREAWQRWFAPDIAFNCLVDELVAIRAEVGSAKRNVRYLWPLLQTRATGRVKAAALFHRTMRQARRLVGSTGPVKGSVPSDDE